MSEFEVEQSVDMPCMGIERFTHIAKDMSDQISIIIEGIHGIGKSAVIHQMADNDNAEMHDIRIAQMEVGDLIGYPYLEDLASGGKIMKFAPPEWYARCMDPNIRTYLLLDEVNRGSLEVRQAVFQLILDRHMRGNYVQNCRIFACVNGNAAVYEVAEMCPSFSDRFWRIELTPSVDEWLMWARKDGNIHPWIISYIAETAASENGVGVLDPPAQIDSRSVDPSRRSWEKLSLMMRKNKDKIAIGDWEGIANKDYFEDLCYGFVGITQTASFLLFCTDTYKRIDPMEILNNYNSVRDQFKAQELPRLYATTEDLVFRVANMDFSYDLKEHDSKKRELQGNFTISQAKNLMAVFDDLPSDMRVALWNRMLNIEPNGGLAGRVILMELGYTGIMQVINDVNFEEIKEKYLKEKSEEEEESANVSAEADE